LRVAAHVEERRSEDDGGRMESEGQTEIATTGWRRFVPRRLRAHAVLTVVVLAVLIGGALRFIPASMAAGSSGNSGAGAGSTACAAK